uniref:HMG box domain-containing protein n=1 Tax=Macrostomum lignano TaxID=282301 RepID=A0A1I8G5N0_9PLAT
QFNFQLFLSMKKKCRSFRSRPRKTSAWSMFLKTMGTNNFSKERMAFLSDKFKSLTAEEKSVYERAAREKVQQTPSVHTLEDLARLMFADYHIIIITKSRSGSNIRTCASPEVAGILNDNIGVLQKFELLSTGLAQSSAQKPTVEHMRKEVRASVRMAY